MPLAREAAFTTNRRLRRKAPEQGAVRGARGRAAGTGTQVAELTQDGANGRNRGKAIRGGIATFSLERATRRPNALLYMR